MLILILMLMLILMLILIHLLYSMHSLALHLMQCTTLLHTVLHCNVLLPNAVHFTATHCTVLFTYVPRSAM